MRSFCFCLAISTISIAFNSSALFAEKIDENALQTLSDTNSPNYSKVADAVLGSAFWATHRGFNRSKVPGPYRFFVEADGDIFDVDDARVALVTKGNSSPDSLKTFSMKAGMGLPFGIAVDAGFSSAVNTIQMTSIFANASFQYLDLSNIVYTDLVPSASVNFGVNYFVSGLSGWGFQTQAIFGGYHREWLAQVGYSLQLTYAMLTGVDPNHSLVKLRHGIGSQWGIYEGFYFRQDIYILPIEAAVSFGYQF